MPDNRCLVHVNKVEDFKAFLVHFGWTIVEPKGQYEVIRATHPKVKLALIYHKRVRTQHLTCMTGLAAKMAGLYIAGVRRERAEAALRKASREVTDEVVAQITPERNQP